MLPSYSTGSIGEPELVGAKILRGTSISLSTSLEFTLKG